MSNFDVRLHSVPSTHLKTVLDVVACTDAQHRAPVLNFLIDTVRPPRFDVPLTCTAHGSTSSTLGLLS